MRDAVDKGTRRIPTYYYAPRKKLFQIIVKLMDTPGSLGAVLTLLGGRVNLLGTMTYSLADGTAIMSAFAEAISVSETPQKLQKLIASSHVALENEVTESKEGLLVDTFHTGIESSMKTPMVLISKDGLAHMFEGLVRIFGSGGDVLLYNEGYFVGEANAVRTVSFLGPTIATKRIDELLYLFSVRGWGQARWADGADSDPPVFRLDDCFECSADEGVKKACSFMRGYLDGWGKVMLGREVKSTEVKCRFNGDEACEFVMDRPKDRP